MLSKPVFSVIIPTFNRRKLLKNAIDSVMAQSLASFELLVIDDGSKDDTYKLVSEYNDDRIIYAYKTNGGQNSANNIGLRLAKGEYIAFLDSDDIWMPEKLERTYAKFASDPEIGVVYNYTGIEKEGKIIQAREDTLEGWCYEEVLSRGYLTSPSFLACKRSCFNEIGEFDENQRACQDDDLCFKLCKKYKVGLIREILGVYGMSADDQIVKDKRRSAKYYFVLIEKYKEEIISVCGMDMMRKKYNRAIRLFHEVGDSIAAQEVENRLKEL